MRKIFKSSLSLILAAVLCFINVSAISQDDGDTIRIDSGYCNEYDMITWQLSKTEDGNVLVVAPKDDPDFLANYLYAFTTDYTLTDGCSNAPWFFVEPSGEGEMINVVEVQNGITRIGTCSFTKQTQLTEVHLYPSLLMIKANAFLGCTALTDVYFHGSKIQWQNVVIQAGNEPIKKAKVHFLTETVTPGDVDGDEVKSDEDAVYLLFHTFFPEDYPVDCDCDFNSDNQLTDMDAIYLLLNTFYPEDYPITNCVITWNQCSEAVMRFINEVTYDPNDYSTSRIREYLPNLPLSSNTKPIGIMVGDTILNNQIPGVENEFSISGYSGTVKPLDRVRWIDTLVNNVRDLGGWKCDGGTIKYGLLYRGGELAARDRSIFVGELGVKRELNLRGTETSNTSSVLGDDVLFYRPEKFKSYTLNNQYIKESLEFVFEGVANGDPVYFHCQAGADRTETIAMILEALLGMSQGDIDKEYELSMFYASNIDRTRSNTGSYGKLLKEVNAYSGDTIRDKVINYVLSIGITVDQINAFRAAMINGTPETIVVTE